MLRVVEDHLGPPRSRVSSHSAIVGLALVVALEHHPPRPAVMVGTLLATAVAVGLAELYSEIVGTEVRTRQRVARARVGEIAADVGAVAFGIGFPAVFFLLSVAGAMEVETAFALAKWSGLGLIGLYGLAAARLAGAGLPVALAQAAAALIGAFLIVLNGVDPLSSATRCQQDAVSAARRGPRPHIRWTKRKRARGGIRGGSKAIAWLRVMAKQASRASPPSRGRSQGARAGRFAPAWHKDVTFGTGRCELCEVE